MQEVSHEKKYVVFRLGSEEFGVAIEHVKEIIQFREVTRMPHVEHYVEGITNLRGDVVPVISLRQRFGLECQESQEKTRIVVMDLDYSVVGFIVDAVVEVRSFDVKQVAPPPSSLASLNTVLFEGIGKVENRLILLLDARRMFSGMDISGIDKAVAGIGRTFE